MFSKIDDNQISELAYYFSQILYFIKIVLYLRFRINDKLLKIGDITSYRFLINY